MNEELKSILKEEIVIGTRIVPVAHLRYTGSSETFVTWTITGETPALAGDDTCLFSTVDVDIDIFSKGNYTEIVGYIKRLMLENDWVWSGDSPEMYEEDTELYHLTCSFEKERSL